MPRQPCEINYPSEPPPLQTAASPPRGLHPSKQLQPARNPIHHPRRPRPHPQHRHTPPNHLRPPRIPHHPRAQPHPPRLRPQRHQLRLRTHLHRDLRLSARLPTPEQGPQPWPGGECAVVSESPVRGLGCDLACLVFILGGKGC